MTLDEKRIADIVAQVVANLRKDGAPESGRTAVPPADASPPSHELRAKDSSDLGFGVYRTVDEAAKAAAGSQEQLAQLDLASREQLVRAIREVGIANAEHFARITMEETGLGRYDHKVQKNINAAKLTPGTEDLLKELHSGAEGVTLTQGAPYGVVCSILPTTHPTPMIINQAIIMVASGNALFACPHPRAAKSTREALRTVNKAIAAAGGPPAVLVAVDKVSVEIVNEVMAHPEVKLVTVAGGPSVVRAALTSGKRAIAAGPGNPPVLVDETADVTKAARDIVAGATFDNNILCIAEKEVFAVASIYDDLVREMEKAGAYRLEGEAVDKLTRLVVKDGQINGAFVGKDAAVILKAIGIELAGGKPEGILIEVPFEHPLVQLEQMMPILPVVRVRDFAEGLELAARAEQGFGHTSQIHSRNLERINSYVSALNTTIVVVNGPSFNGLSTTGTSVFSHTVASTTGEGICTPRTFTRQRNTTMSGVLAQC